MPDGYFGSLPIPYNVRQDPNALAEEITQLESTKANKSTTINGKDLSADRVIYSQDIPSKNLLPNTASTTTTNGVTFTINSDGSISTSGTASASTTFYVARDFSLPSASYAFSGCPQGGSTSSYWLAFQIDGAYTDNADTGNGFTKSGVVTGCGINIISGTNMNGLTFRPMIRLASIEDDSYVPFSKTAVELSKDLYGPLMRRTIVNFGNVTIGSSGYTSLDASLIPSPPDGYVSAFALIQNYSSATPQVAFGINSTGTFAFGSQMTITALRIAYFFIRKSAFGES